MTYRCPTCKKPVKEGEKHFPFCSERCRWVDLGHWLDEDYRIPVADRPVEAGVDPAGEESDDPDGDARAESWDSGGPRDG